MKIEQIEIDSLIPYANNSRTHSAEQIEQIKASIDEFGFNNPVLIDENDGIIAGHGRVLAAQKLALEKVPCIRLNHLSEAQKRAYVIADNKLADNAGWDQAMLRDELRDLDEIGFDVGLTGFGAEELAAMREWEAPEDKVPSAPKVPTTKIGDIWNLGAHRMICGDVRDNAVVQSVMAGSEADMVWTDPPYNVDYRNGAILNDALSSSIFYNLLCAGFSSMFEATKDGGSIYIAHAEIEGLNFRNAMADAGWMQKQCLVWVKNAAVLGRQDYNWKHEPILYGWKQGAAHYFVNDFTQDTVVDDDVDIQKMKATELRDMVKKLRNAQPTSVIREDRPHRSDLHPTMKPVELVARMIRNSSRESELVLDGFAGSGTTLIAATKTGRWARLVDLDEHYTDVCVIRWQSFTGQKATLESTGKTFDEVSAERKTVDGVG